MLKTRTIFLVSPAAWDFIFVSKHHYAMELAKRGNRVFFVNPPQEGKPGQINIREVPGQPGLHLVDYSPKYRGLRFLPRFAMRWADQQLLKAVEKQAGVRFDVIWNFENSRFFDLRFAGKNVLKIYFQVDENQDFHPSVAAFTADTVFAINTEIFDIVRPHNPRSYLVPHSYQGHLSELAERIVNGEYAYKRPGGPLSALYVGNLEHAHIDVDLFEEVVRRNTAVSFRLLGPYRDSTPLYQRLRNYSNVEFLGKKPYQEIPALLDTADLLMLVYDDGFSQSSHKLLEYLASGKAIVSTYMREYDTEDPLVYLSRNRGQYLDLFNQTVSAIEQANDPSLMRKRIRFALDHTYARQLDRMEELIRNAIPGATVQTP